MSSITIQPIGMQSLWFSHSLLVTSSGIYNHIKLREKFNFRIHFHCLQDCDHFNCVRFLGVSIFESHATSSDVSVLCSLLLYSCRSVLLRKVSRAVEMARYCVCVCVFLVLTSLVSLPERHLLIEELRL